MLNGTKAHIVRNIQANQPSVRPLPNSPGGNHNPSGTTGENSDNAPALAQPCLLRTARGQNDAAKVPA